MQLNFDKVNNILIVSIEGEIDHHTAEEIRTRIEDEFYSLNVKNMIFDFSKVTFMDSSGIGMVIGRYKHVKNFGGKVVVAKVNETFDRIFKISGLYKIIKCYETLDEAVSAISGVIK